MGLIESILSHFSSSPLDHVRATQLFEDANGCIFRELVKYHDDEADELIVENIPRILSLIPSVHDLDPSVKNGVIAAKVEKMFDVHLDLLREMEGDDIPQQLLSPAAALVESIVNDINEWADCSYPQWILPALRLKAASEYTPRPFAYKAPDSLAYESVKMFFESKGGRLNNPYRASLTKLMLKNKHFHKDFNLLEAIYNAHYHLKMVASACRTDEQLDQLTGIEGKLNEWIKHLLSVEKAGDTSS